VRFFGLGFFHGPTLYGPQILRLKEFSIALMYNIIFPFKSAMYCRLLRRFKISAVAYCAY
jgi:hypothetical protein